MRKHNFIILVTLLLVSYFFSLGFADNNKKSTLSWIGYLRLPKAKEHKHYLLDETKNPQFWEKWESERKQRLDWLPKGDSRKKTVINDKIVVKLVSKATSSKSKRKRRRNND